MAVKKGRKKYFSFVTTKTLVVLVLRFGIIRIGQETLKVIVMWFC